MYLLVDPPASFDDSNADLVIIIIGAHARTLNIICRYLCLLPFLDTRWPILRAVFDQGSSCGLVARVSFRNWECIKSGLVGLMDSEDDPSPPPSIPLQSTVCMQSPNLVAGTSVSRRNENTG